MVRHSSICQAPTTRVRLIAGTYTKSGLRCGESLTLLITPMPGWLNFSSSNRRMVNSLLVTKSNITWHKQPQTRCWREQVTNTKHCIKYFTSKWASNISYRNEFDSIRQKCIMQRLYIFRHVNLYKTRWPQRTHSSLVITYVHRTWESQHTEAATRLVMACYYLQHIRNYPFTIIIIIIITIQLSAATRAARKCSAVWPISINHLQCIFFYTALSIYGWKLTNWLSDWLTHQPAFIKDDPGSMESLNGLSKGNGLSKENP